MESTATITPGLINPSKVPFIGRYFSIAQSDRKTFPQVTSDFLYWCKYGRDNPVSKQTLESYERGIARLSKFFANIDVTKITLAHVMDFKKTLYESGVSQGYVQKLLCLLRSILRFAQTQQGLEVLSPSRIELPSRIKHEVSYLTVGEADRFLKEIDISSLFGVRFYALVVTLMVTLMRISEALSLNRDSIIRGDKPYTMVMGKGNKPRKVYFNEWALYWIDQYLALRTDTDQALFTVHTSNKQSFRWTPGHVRRVFKKYARKTEILKATPHALRRTGATILRKNGANIKAIQTLLGHSSMRITEVYIGNDEEWVQEEHTKFMAYGLENVKEVKIKTQWSWKYEHCQGCKTIQVPHAAKGFCNNCYSRQSYNLKKQS